MRDSWRVAVIDSGLADGARLTVVGARRFVDNGLTVSAEPAICDPIGHGTAVTTAICSMSASAVELMIGQVLDEKGVSTPATVAAAISWAVEARADLIHMSLGLREDRRVLADAVAAAILAGCVIIASAPARGGISFPAAHAGVIRATGDARCADGEISVLGTAQADFGGCPRSPASPRNPASPHNPASPRPGGASIGAANVSAIVLARLAPGSGSERVRAQLTQLARYRGTERKIVASTATGSKVRAESPSSS